MYSKSRKIHLYDKYHTPNKNFNQIIIGWLRSEIEIYEHKSPAAFLPVQILFDKEIEFLEQNYIINPYRYLLSRLTPMLLNFDLSSHLKGRLLGDLINETGFRSALSQGQAKNNGENFVNVIVYALAHLLKDQDDIIVDKGTPPSIKSALCLNKTISLYNGTMNIKIPIECDFAIFSRSNPTNAIVISAKTRLKEVFHIGTMWKLLFDIAGDNYCEKKWGINSNGDLHNIKYCFVTADMIPLGGSNTQGPDVERDMPRNLIAMDASFFDYVFVSKSGINHVSTYLNINGKREALFHELGCLVDLIEQKFNITIRK